MFLCIIILLMLYFFVYQLVVCCYFLCPWYTVPSRGQFSTEHFCALPILQSKEPPQEEISAAFLSPPKCNISDQKKSNIIGWDPGCVEMCPAVVVLGLVCCVWGDREVVG